MRVIIDLFAAFDDVEHIDADLTYTVVDNTNPGLFRSVTIDPVADRLPEGSCRAHGLRETLLLELVFPGRLSTRSHRSDEGLG